MHKQSIGRSLISYISTSCKNRNLFLEIVDAFLDRLQSLYFGLTYSWELRNGGVLGLKIALPDIGTLSGAVCIGGTRHCREAIMDNEV